MLGYVDNQIGESDKDTLTKRISVITATEQVIQHMSVLNLRTI